jgi:ubiquinone/menaquinone biosynthesis C-methylase UbiE
MNSFENWFCASGLWRRMTRATVLPWMLEGTHLGERILELGAGPGAATAELARRGSVISLDYSHNFCTAIHSKNAAANVVQGNAAALPFESGTFTGAIAILVLHHLRSRTAQDQAFAEIFRVLRPGGIFVVLEIPDSWLARLVHLRSTFVPRGPHELQSGLTAAGFSNSSLKERGGAFCVRTYRPVEHPQINTAPR